MRPISMHDDNRVSLLVIRECIRVLRMYITRIYTIIGSYDNKAGLCTLRYGPGYKQREILIMEDDTFSAKSARDYLYSYITLRSPDDAGAAAARTAAAAGC